MVKGNPRLLRGIEQLLKPDAKVAGAVARAVDQELRAATGKQFASEGAEGGTPWVALSPAYKERKDRLFAHAITFNQGLAAARGRKLKGSALSRALGAQNKILQLTGDMKRAFTRKDDPDHVAEGSVLGGRIVVRFGAVLPEGKAHHQEGASPLPARPILAFSAGAVGRAREKASQAMVPFIMQRQKALARLGL